MKIQCNIWLIIISLIFLLLYMPSCTKEYWLTDPVKERMLLALPVQHIRVRSEPQGARVVIATLWNPQVFSGIAPVEVNYRPHPFMPSWILVGKQGYRSTAIRINKELRKINLYVILARATEEDIYGPNIMEGPMLGRPAIPRRNPARMMRFFF